MAEEELDREQQGTLAIQSQVRVAAPFSEF